MGSLSPHPSVEGRGLVCHPPFHREGFPPAMRFPCADERGGGWSSMEGCLLDLTRQLRSQAASFPTVAKKPQQSSQLPKRLFSTFFSPFVSFWVTTALSLSGLSLYSLWWRAEQAQCWGWEFVLGSFFRRAPIGQVVSKCDHQEVPYIKLSTGVSELLIYRCYSRALSAAPSSHSQHTHLSCRQLQKWLWWNLLSSSCLTSLFQMTAHHLSLCRPGSG